MKKRMLSLLLSVCMIVTMLPTAAFAADGETPSGAGAAACTHHTAHTAECGYVEAVEGQACNHVHNTACGYAEATAGTPAQDEHYR